MHVKILRALHVFPPSVNRTHDHPRTVYLASTIGRSTTELPVVISFLLIKKNVFKPFVFF